MRRIRQSVKCAKTKMGSASSPDVPCQCGSASWPLEMVRTRGAGYLTKVSAGTASDSWHVVAEFRNKPTVHGRNPKRGLTSGDAECTSYFNQPMDALQEAEYPSSNVTDTEGVQAI